MTYQHAKTSLDEKKIYIYISILHENACIVEKVQEECTKVSKYQNKIICTKVHLIYLMKLYNVQIYIV